MVMFASSLTFSSVFSFFSLFDFCNRKHSFQVRPSYCPGIRILHQVQALDVEEEEEELLLPDLTGFFPFFLLP